MGSAARRRRLSGSREKASRVFVDLSSGVQGEYVDDLGVAVHSEQDAPPAHAGLANTGTLGERSRKTRIERVMRELADSCPDPAFRGPVETIQQPLRFVSDTDAIYHKPRSRS